MDAVKTIEALTDLLESVTEWWTALAIVIVALVVVCRNRIPVWIERGAEHLSNWREEKKRASRRRTMEPHVKAAQSFWFTERYGNPVRRVNYGAALLVFGSPILVWNPYYNDAYEVTSDGLFHVGGPERYRRIDDLIDVLMAAYQREASQSFGIPGADTGTKAIDCTVWVYPHDILVFSGEMLVGRKGRPTEEDQGA